MLAPIVLLGAFGFCSIKLIEIVIREQIRLDVLDCFFKRTKKLVKIFFIEKDFLLLKPVVPVASFALGDGQVIIIAAGCAYIKNVRSLAGSYFD